MRHPRKSPPRRKRGGMLIQFVLGLLLLAGLLASSYSHFSQASARREVMAWQPTIALLQEVLLDVYNDVDALHEGWGPVNRAVSVLRQQQMWVTWENGSTQQYVSNDGMRIRIQRDRSFIISLPSEVTCNMLFDTAPFDHRYYRYSNDCRQRQQIWGYFKHQ